MPIYQCAAPREWKARVAAAITDAHVEATGAPRVFVHVFFNEMPPTLCSLHNLQAGHPVASAAPAA